MRISQAEGECPRGFFLVPADKKTWSLAKRADCLSLYESDVQLFFVCRMFFEELKAAAAMSKAKRDDLIKRRSSEPEFSEPIMLKLPRVRERLSLPDIFVPLINKNRSGRKMLFQCPFICYASNTQQALFFGLSPSM